MGKESAKMGFEGHPAMRGKGDDEPESVFYPSGNKSTMAACRVMARKKDGFRRAASTSVRRKNNARPGSSCGFP